jgi:hypothetical protein
MTKKKNKKTRRSKARVLNTNVALHEISIITTSPFKDQWKFSLMKPSGGVVWERFELIMPFFTLRVSQYTRKGNDRLYSGEICTSGDSVIWFRNAYQSAAVAKLATLREAQSIFSTVLPHVEAAIVDGIGEVIFEKKVEIQSQASNLSVWADDDIL